MQLPNLKHYRERALLTQAELAERASLSEMTINRIEGGQDARFRTIRKLAEALKVDAAELVAQHSRP
jgi:transcriptional regulator with XRE-family HTH domain